MTTELKVVMFTDQVDSTSNMRQRPPAEIEKVTTSPQKPSASVVALYSKTQATVTYRISLLLGRRSMRVRHSAARQGAKRCSDE